MSEIFVPRSWREALDRLGGRRETFVVASVVGLLVFGALAFWTRGAPASIAPPARASSSPTSSTPSPSSAVLVVHVAGAVARPGIYEVPVGARVADAIELAGGPLPRADLDLLNLAALVADATQVFVPVRGEAGVATSPSSAPTQPGLVNLNTADQIALESIPGLGPVKAAAILAVRAEIGSFTSIDQLLEVSGIGPATLESLRPYVSL